MCIEKRCRSIERRIALVKYRRIGLKDVWHAGHDLKRDFHVVNLRPVRASLTASLSRISWEPAWISMGGSPRRSANTGLMNGSEELPLAT